MIRPKKETPSPEIRRLKSLAFLTPPASGRGEKEVMQEVSSFRPVKTVVVVLLLMFAISIMAIWYGSNVNIPRYCGKVGKTIIALRRVMTEKTPAGSESRRPYIIAAKLLFLIPKQSQENTESYLMRVKKHIREECIR